MARRFAALWLLGVVLARSCAALNSSCDLWNNMFASPIQQKICFQADPLGTVLCLGNSVPWPKRIGFDDVRDMAFSEYAACSVNGKGQVSCLGYNINGDLGLGLQHENYYYYPRRYVKLRNGLSAASVTANGQGFCVLYTNGMISCWGSPVAVGAGLGPRKVFGASEKTMGDNLPLVNLGQESGQTLTATQLVSSVGTNCALLHTGQVKCWGQCDQGECDYGGDTSDTYVGVYSGQMGNNLPFIPLADKARYLAAGAYHMCAILVDGSMQCWGKGGALGLDSMADTDPSIFLAQRVTDSPHSQHARVVQSEGDYNNGSTAAPTLPTFPKVRLTGNIVQVAAGYQFTCVLMDTGRAKCFGEGSNGQLGFADGLSRGQGQGPPWDMASLDTAFISLQASALYIVCSTRAAAALLVDNRIEAWGSAVDLYPVPNDVLVPSLVQLCTNAPTATAVPTTSPLANECGGCLDPGAGASLPSGCVPPPGATKTQCAASAKLWAKKKCRLAPSCVVPSSPVVWLPDLIKKGWAPSTKQACQNAGCQFFNAPLQVPCPSLCAALPWAAVPPQGGCAASEFQPVGSQCVVPKI